MKLNKKIIICVSLPIILLGLFGCDSKEKKAFDNAIQSREISQMRNFINQYSDADQKLVDSAKVILAVWEQDSIEYSVLEIINNVVDRAEAELLYMNKYPNGLFKDLVIEMYEIDGPKAEAIRECLDKYNKNFTNYAFYDPETKYNGPICLTPPDANGKGIGFNYTIFGYMVFYYTINLNDLDDDTISCTYYLINNKEIPFTISYSPSDHCLYYRINGRLNTLYGQVDPNKYGTFLKDAEEIRKKGEIIRLDLSWL